MQRDKIELNWNAGEEKKKCIKLKSNGNGKEIYKIGMEKKLSRMKICLAN